MTLVPILIYKCHGLKIKSPTEFPRKDDKLTLTLVQERKEPTIVRTLQRQKQWDTKRDVLCGIGNWLMQLWKLRSHTRSAVCKLEAEKSWWFNSSPKNQVLTKTHRQTGNKSSLHLLFCSSQAFKGQDDAHPNWGW